MDKNRERDNQALLMSMDPDRVGGDFSYRSVETGKPTLVIVDREMRLNNRVMTDVSPESYEHWCL